MMSIAARLLEATSAAIGGLDMVKMRNSLVYGIAALTVMVMMGTARAETISGVFNTGQSEVEAAQGATLDIKFHPCDYDAEKTCGTVVALHQDPSEPVRPMPDGSPVVGFLMIKDLTPVGKNQFKRGKINAIDESIEKDKMVWYGLRVRDNKDGTLTARGCLGFVCPRVMTWNVVVDDGPEIPDTNGNE